MSNAKRDVQLPDAMNDDRMEIRCPVCRTDSSYQQVDHRRPDGTAFDYPIYRCTGCDFHFLDPAVYPVERE
jgi:hypothetical protein